MIHLPHRACRHRHKQQRSWKLRKQWHGQKMARQASAAAVPTDSQYQSFPMGQARRTTHRDAAAALLADSLLCPADAKGTAGVLQPAWQHLSPALGLLLLNSPQVVTNLHTVGALQEPFAVRTDKTFCSGKADTVAIELDAAASLATLLYFQPAANPELALGLPPVRAGRNRSQAASWWGTVELGGFLGQSLCDYLSAATVAGEDLDARLKSLGIKTNTVAGQKTGVSLARHRELATAIHAALAAGPSPTRFDLHAFPTLQQPNLGLLLLLRLVWERATSKRCLYNFLVAVDNAVRGSGIEGGILRVPLDQIKWVGERFTPDELNPKSLAAAAETLLENPCDTESDAEHADALELLAAGLSTAAATKPRLPAGRYGWAGGEPRPDCVEVMIREIIELLLYVPSTGQVEPALLPPTTSRELRQFYDAKYADGAVVAAGIPVHSSAGAAWFKICQGLTGVPYLSSSASTSQAYEYDCEPSRRQVARYELGYEVAPTLTAVVAVLQHLLQPVQNLDDKTAGDEQERCIEQHKQWLTLEDFADWWNQLNPSVESAHAGLIRPQLVVETQRTVHRAPHGEEPVHRELASLSVHKPEESEVPGYTPYAALDLVLERQHEMATATPGSVPRLWKDQASSMHRPVWLDSGDADTTNNKNMTTHAAWVVWPSLLEGSMVEDTATRHMGGRHDMWAVLAADWSKPAELEVAIKTMVGTQSVSLRGRLLPPLIAAARASGLSAQSVASALGPSLPSAADNISIARAINAWPLLVAVQAVDAACAQCTRQPRCTNSQDSHNATWTNLRGALAALPTPKDLFEVAKYGIWRLISTGILRIGGMSRPCNDTDKSL